LRRLAAHLHSGGVFGLWSNEPLDDAFIAALGEVFATTWAEVVTFDNPLQRRTSTNTVYLACTPWGVRRRGSCARGGTAPAFHRATTSAARGVVLQP
jgi:hypothetical protein